MIHSAANTQLFLARLTRLTAILECVRPNIPPVSSFCLPRSIGSQNVPLMVMLAKATAETVKEVPRVANVIATVANMCCRMVQRRVYE